MVAAAAWEQARMAGNTGRREGVVAKGDSRSRTARTHMQKLRSGTDAECVAEGGGRAEMERRRCHGSIGETTAKLGNTEDKRALEQTLATSNCFLTEV